MPRRKRQQPEAPPPPLTRVQQLAVNPPLLLSNPGPSTRAEKIADHAVSDLVKQHGNSAEYLVARIARDRPDVLERMKAGEFATVWAAAKAADIVKQPSGLTRLRRAWRAATPAGRKAFLAEIRKAGSK